MIKSTSASALNLVATTLQSINSSSIADIRASSSLLESNQMSIEDIRLLLQKALSPSNKNQVLQQSLPLLIAQMLSQLTVERDTSLSQVDSNINVIQAKISDIEEDTTTCPFEKQLMLDGLNHQLLRLKARKRLLSEKYQPLIQKTEALKRFLSSFSYTSSDLTTLLSSLNAWNSPLSAGHQQSIKSLKAAAELLLLQAQVKEYLDNQVKEQAISLLINEEKETAAQQGITDPVIVITEEALTTKITELSGAEGDNFNQLVETLIAGWCLHIPLQSPSLLNGIGYGLLNNLPKRSLALAEIVSIVRKGLKVQASTQADDQINPPSSSSTTFSQDAKVEMPSEEDELRVIEEMTLSYSQAPDAQLQASPVDNADEKKAVVQTSPPPLIGYSEDDTVVVHADALSDLIVNLTHQAEELEPEEYAPKVMKYLSLVHVDILNHQDSEGKITKEGFANIAMHMKAASNKSGNLAIRNLLDLLSKHFSVAWYSREFAESSEREHFVTDVGASIEQGQSLEVGLGVGISAGSLATVSLMPTLTVEKGHTVQTQDDGKMVASDVSATKVSALLTKRTSLAPGVRGKAEGRVTRSYYKKIGQTIDDDVAGRLLATPELRGVAKERYVEEKTRVAQAKSFMKQVFSSAKLADYKRKAINAGNTVESLEQQLKELLGKHYIIQAPSHIYSFAKELITSEEKTLGLDVKGRVSLGLGSLASSAQGTLVEYASISGIEAGAGASISKKHLVESKVIHLEQAICSGELPISELPPFMLSRILKLIGDDPSEKSLTQAFINIKEDLTEYFETVGLYDFKVQELDRFKFKLIKSDVEKKLIEQLKREVKTLKEKKKTLQGRWCAENRGQLLQMIAVSLGYLKLQCQQLGVTSLDAPYKDAVYALRHPTISLDPKMFVSLTSLLHSVKSKESASIFATKLSVGPLSAEVNVTSSKTSHFNPFKSTDTIKVQLKLTTTDIASIATNLANMLNKVTASIYYGAGLTLDLLVDIKLEMVDSLESELNYQFSRYTPPLSEEVTPPNNPYQRDYVRIKTGSVKGIKFGVDIAAPGVGGAVKAKASKFNKDLAVKEEHIGTNSLHYLVLRHIGFVGGTDYSGQWVEFMTRHSAQLQKLICKIPDNNEHISKETRCWFERMKSEAASSQERKELEALEHNLFTNAQFFASQPSELTFLTAVESLRETLKLLAVYALNKENEGRQTIQPKFKKRTNIKF